MITLSNEELIEIIVHLTQASLEIDKLKPHVGDSQLNAAMTIKKHLHDVTIVINKHIKTYKESK